MARGVGDEVGDGVAEGWSRSCGSVSEGASYHGLGVNL